MKKIYSILMLGMAFAVFNTSASAQCVPDLDNTVVGTTPSDFPIACQADLYDEVIQIRLKKDSTFEDVPTPIGPQTATVFAKEIEIAGFTGLPEGLEFNCENSNCKKVMTAEAGFDNTCLGLFGTPTTEGTGVATMTLKITFDVGGYFDSTVTTTTEFEYTVQPTAACSATGIEEIVTTDFSISPNPISSSSMVDLSLETSGDVVLKVYDILGSEVSTESLGMLKEGTHELSSVFLTSLSSGIYVVKLVKNGNETEFVQKIIVD